MSPLLNSGDVVDVDETAYDSHLPQVGDIVLSAHPFISSMQMIKQVHSKPTDTTVYLLGLNPTESTDSRSFGAVPASLIKGKVLLAGSPD